MYWRGLKAENSIETQLKILLNIKLELKYSIVIEYSTFQDFLEYLLTLIYKMQLKTEKIHFILFKNYFFNLIFWKLKTNFIFFNKCQTVICQLAFL